MPVYDNQGGRLNADGQRDPFDAERPFGYITPSVTPPFTVRRDNPPYYGGNGGSASVSGYSTVMTSAGGGGSATGRLTSGGTGKAGSTVIPKPPAKKAPVPPDVLFLYGYGDTSEEVAANAVARAETRYPDNKFRVRGFTYEDFRVFPNSLYGYSGPIENFRRLSGYLLRGRVRLDRVIGPSAPPAIPGLTPEQSRLAAALTEPGPPAELRNRSVLVKALAVAEEVAKDQQVIGYLYNLRLLTRAVNEYLGPELQLADAAGAAEDAAGNVEAVKADDLKALKTLIQGVKNYLYPLKEKS